MPRNGSGVYLPPSPPVQENTSIESAVYNGFVDDIAGDLNDPRPITVGGTGKDNAHDAMLALKGEIAKQEVVNYNSHLWANGSFWAAGTATGGPVDGHAFIGTYYEQDANLAVIMAHDMADTVIPGRTYVREKKVWTVGQPVAWGTWKADSLQPTEVLMLTGSQTTSGGFRFTAFNAGAFATGTFTPDAYNSNYQYYNNDGAHAIAVPANDCAIDLLITNGAAAGAITFTGYVVGNNTGDLLTTAAGHKFMISLRRINSVATYVIKALQ